MFCVFPLCRGVGVLRAAATGGTAPGRQAATTTQEKTAEFAENAEKTQRKDLSLRSLRPRRFLQIVSRVTAPQHIDLRQQTATATITTKTRRLKNSRKSQSSLFVFCDFVY